MPRTGLWLLWALCLQAFALVAGGPPIKRGSGRARDRAASSYTQLIVFGDSYSDDAHRRPVLLVTGSSIVNSNTSVTTPSWTTTNDAANSSAPATRASASADAATTGKGVPYWEGRASNGPVWNEYLAPAMNAQLINYAYSGAYIQNNEVATYILDLTQQVDLFLADRRTGNVDSAGQVTDKALVIIFIGINTVNRLWIQLVNSLASTSLFNAMLTAQDYVIGNVTLLVDNIQKLNSSGVFGVNLPDFLILPTLPMQDILLDQAASGTNTAVLADVAAVGIGFNARINAVITSLNSTISSTQRILTFDLPTWWNAIFTDPAAFGLLNTTSPCVNAVTYAVCANASAFQSYDGLHPTTTVHEMLALELLKVINA